VTRHTGGTVLLVAARHALLSMQQQTHLRCRASTIKANQSMKCAGAVSSTRAAAAIDCLSKQRVLTRRHRLSAVHATSLETLPQVHVAQASLDDDKSLQAQRARLRDPAHIATGGTSTRTVQVRLEGGSTSGNHSQKFHSLPLIGRRGLEKGP
jgi:hypothetical protein